MAKGKHIRKRVRQKPRFTFKSKIEYKEGQERIRSLMDKALHEENEAEYRRLAAEYESNLIYYHETILPYIENVLPEFPSSLWW